MVPVALIIVWTSSCCLGERESLLLCARDEAISAENRHTVKAKMHKIGIFAE